MTLKALFVLIARHVHITNPYTLTNKTWTSGHLRVGVYKSLPPTSTGVGQVLK
jgi:hypothetical protein